VPKVKNIAVWTPPEEKPVKLNDKNNIGVELKRLLASLNVCSR
jgi:hypothetical protein